MFGGGGLPSQQTSCLEVHLHGGLYIVAVATVAGIFGHFCTGQTDSNHWSAQNMCVPQMVA